MPNQNINFAQNTIQKIQRPKKRRGVIYKVVRFLLICLLAIFILLFALSYRAIFSQETLGKTIAKLPVVNQIKTLFGGHDILLPQEDSDRVNFLIMGIGGAGHDGALLTDTMMLASVKLSTNQIALISIPRDLLVKIPDNGWQRINHANAYGEVNGYPGGGSALAAKTVEQTFGVTINYWARIDFSGFEKMIDDMGGLNIYIDKSFTDNEYPTEDYEVQTISFKQGWEHMNGERALQFARSRHGDNWEGSDFARSKRQQKILLAIKDKLLNWKTFINPNRIYSIYDNLSSNLQTNIKAGQLTQMVGLLKDLDYENIEHYTIDDSPGGLLKPIVTEEGAQVLAPKTGGLDEIQDFVKNIFVVKDIFDRNISVIIANGTIIEGLATYTGSMLESWGFEIARLITSPQQDFEKTVIYDLAEGDEDEEALKILKKRMDANTAGLVPEFLRPVLSRTDDYGQEQKIEANFLVVVGADQVEAIEAIEEWKSAEEARLKVIGNSEEEEEKETEEKTDGQE